MFVPSSLVIRRSVFFRRVKQGTRSAVVSSWIPPESVTTAAALASRERNCRYGNGSVRRIACRTAEISSRPRVHRKDHRQGLGDVFERSDRPCKQIGIVDEARAMEGDEDVAPGFKPELAPGFECDAQRPRSLGACRSSCSRRMRSCRRALLAPRFLFASSLCVRSRAERWSVMTRLRSSGIDQSSLRKPDSM